MDRQFRTDQRSASSPEALSEAAFRRYRANDFGDRTPLELDRWRTLLRVLSPTLPQTAEELYEAAFKFPPNVLRHSPDGLRLLSDPLLRVWTTTTLYNMEREGFVHSELKDPNKQSHIRLYSLTFDPLGQALPHFLQNGKESDQ